ncbi:AimR family lysis-lysogeny pheromone receptor [Oceanobacillus halotolerans]|uniref:AimR family lysis-lysogeny pheromone receptor n=1 Tax=Oceanobacillus halotolerans TaxID=2663380 RepID=UPI0013DD60DA|nr:AimR family lysis-lysogeny pheromone receptor [Oceanobacillus halotolerans]
MKYIKSDLMPNSAISLTMPNELSLDQVILLLKQEHDPETANELTRKFCIQSDSDEINKKGMEFLYVNSYLEDLQQLVNKNKASSSISNRKWAAVYQLFLERKRQLTPVSELLRRAEWIETNEPELKCLLEFFKIYIACERREFGDIGNFLEKQQYLFDNINDSFLISYFRIRLYQVLFIYYWKRNELIMARKYAFRALNNIPSVRSKINLHIDLGLTYTYDTFKQGMYHMNEALSLSKQHNYNQLEKRIVQQDIPFLAAQFNETDGIATQDQGEQAHLEIAKGNHDQAIRILNQIPLDTPFKIYYLGLAKQDRNILMHAYKTFIEKRSDFFFSKLPMNALKQLDIAY